MISDKELFLRLGWMPSDKQYVPPVKDGTTFDEKVFKDKIISIISEIPSNKIALLLSGGVDSALMGLLAKQTGKEIIAYTVSYLKEKGEEDSANDVAMALGLIHKVVKVSEKECLSIFEKYVKHHDKIHAEWSGLPLTLLMQQVKEDGIDHVLLGDGGDDYFGGYVFFQMLYDFEKSLMDRIKDPYHRALRLYGIYRDIMNESEYFEITGTISHLAFNEFIIDHLKKYFSSGDLVQGLVDFDCYNWLEQAMIPKVEAGCNITRVVAHSPLLDKSITNMSYQLDGEWRVNKRALRKCFIGTPLEKFMGKPKLGFKPPFIQWLQRDPWKGYLLDNVDGFNKDYIEKNLLGDFVGSLFAFRCLTWNKYTKK